jgi:hypothetical protein
MDMLAETTEWLNQSEYDFETAQAMYKTKRTVCLCYFHVPFSA